MKGIEHRQIETNNGHKLSSTFYLPDGEMKGAVIIAVSYTHLTLPTILRV